MFLLKFFSKNYVAISNPPKQDNIKIKYNWQTNIQGVAKQYQNHNAQDIVKKLSVGDPLRFAIYKDSTDKIAIIYHDQEQIGWYVGNHYDEVMTCIMENKPISIEVSNKGKVKGTNIYWCSIRIKLYEI